MVASPRVNATTKICLRSYAVPTHPVSAITVVEAILATCATQPSFEPVTFGLGYRKKEYIGAGLGANNPALQVIAEANSLFGKESTVASLLSVGSGHPGVITLASGGTEVDLYRVMREMMNDCTERAREIKRKVGRAGIYFRFSVEQGMQKDHLSQIMDVDWIVTQTESYLEDQIDQLDAFMENNHAPNNLITLGRLSMFYTSLFLLSDLWVGSGDVPTLPGRFPSNPDIMDLDISGMLNFEHGLYRLTMVYQ